MQLRFVAEDIPPGALVEAAVDDFTLAAVLTPVTDVSVDEIRRRNGIVSCSPNPFNPRIAIVFRTGQAAKGELKVYDVSGRSVRTLIDGPLEAGEGRIVFDGRDDAGKPLASGIYFVRLDTPKVMEVRQITLLK
ncbi:MAG: T9SS type A sorting domain-containing protein [Candidatus Eisenbacteria bacterium]|nr:T9SS type A sorting domain-containing protein [Candidatus Latescibacterota bacterium]MBD3302470.1 T9SS type A sorting domain-containing protein [Candidatus Eisenbacteria bacterium]